MTQQITQEHLVSVSSYLATVTDNLDSTGTKKGAHKHHGAHKHKKDPSSGSNSANKGKNSNNPKHKFTPHNPNNIDNPTNATGTNTDPSSSSYEQWLEEYDQAVDQWYSAFQEWLALDKEMESGKGGEFAAGTLLMLASEVLIPDKMTLGQVQMEKQAYEIQDLSRIEAEISELQKAFQNPDYNSDASKDFDQFKQAVDNLQNTLKDDPWLQTQYILNPNDPGAPPIKVNGILGDPKDPNSNYALISNELNDFQNIVNGGELYLTGLQSDYFNGRTDPTVTSIVNDFSQMTNQISGVSSFERNQLQFEQQDYSKIAQASQDILSDIIKQITTETSNSSKM